MIAARLGRALLVRHSALGSRRLARAAYGRGGKSTAESRSRKKPSAESERREPSAAAPRAERREPSPYGRPHQRTHPSPRPGPDRPRGHVPRQAGRGLPHHRRRWRHPRQGRHDARRLADLQYRRGGRGEDRRQRVGDLRAAAGRRRRRDGSRRRRHSAGRLHHRGHSDHRHDAGADVPRRRADDAADRTELPGPHLRRASARRASSPATSASAGASGSCRRAARSPTRRFTSSRSSGWGRPRASASAATR